MAQAPKAKHEGRRRLCLAGTGDGEGMTEPASLEERVQALEHEVRALRGERDAHTQELDWLRERNRALESAMAASAALIQEAIEPSEVSGQEAQQPS